VNSKHVEITEVLDAVLMANTTNDKTIFGY
jgi:hypothetical protein